MVSIEKISENENVLVYEYWLNKNDKDKRLFTYDKQKNTVGSVEKFLEDGHKKNIYRAIEGVSEYYRIHNFYPDYAEWEY